MVRATALAPTLLLAALPAGGEDSSYSSLTEWLNIVQSLVLPFVVIPLIQLTSNKRVMGTSVNSRVGLVVMSIILAFLVGMNCYTVVSFGLDQLPSEGWAQALFGIACAVYGLFVLYFLVGPRRVDRWVCGGVKAVATRAKPTIERAVDMVEVHF